MIENIDIIGTMRDCGIVKKAEVLPKGHVRIETALLYPDGSSIDVFAEKDRGLSEGVRLSDFGQTFALLEEYQVRPWESRDHMEVLERYLGVLDVGVEGDKLVRQVDTIEDLPGAVLRLGQACVGASCMIFTR
jgi:hypothetical protein